MRWVALAVVLFAATASAEEHTVSVRADRAWTSTKLVVKRGQQWTISAHGTITRSGRSFGPGGATGTGVLIDVEAHYPLASAKPFALIARIGQAAAFVVGETTTITAPGDGELFLGINDDQVTNNRGEWTVRIADGGATVGGAPAQGLDDSTWRPCEGGNDVTFHRGGALDIAKATCGAARWKLDGKHLTYDCNGFTGYDATIEGDVIRGTWFHIKTPADTGALCLHRVVAGEDHIVAHANASTKKPALPAKARQPKKAQPRPVKNTRPPTVVRSVQP
jgi:hypothetical protein